MNFLREFFRSLFLSCTSLEYYNEVYRKPMAFSWKYLIVFYVLIAAVVAGAFTYAFEPVQPSLIGIGSPEWRTMVGMFPSDLQLSLGKTGIHINKSLPYAIPITKELLQQQEPAITDAQYPVLREEMTKRGFPINAFTFIDADTINTDTFPQYQSFAVVARREVAMKKSTTSPSITITAMPHLSLPFAITRTRLEKFTGVVQAFHLYDRSAFTFFVFTFGTLFLWMVMMVGSLVRIGVSSLIMMAVWTKKIRYKKVFQLSIHAYTPLILVSFIPVPSSLPWFATILRLAYFVWMFVILQRLERDGIIGLDQPKKTTPQKKKS